ncbi:hypothetical protein SETIT_7G068100v2 [Setaria italica]|uniref:Uncharacterized protein n=1 Tax=Setaria italica TaxID=4555 RepID=A0A368RSM3_SETIT|nr:hypothetical protein SETIT_7G068100v2 [Setaria italica]
MWFPSSGSVDCPPPPLTTCSTLVPCHRTRAPPVDQGIKGKREATIVCRCPWPCLSLSQNSKAIICSSMSPIPMRYFIFFNAKVTSWCAWWSRGVPVYCYRCHDHTRPSLDGSKH